MKRNKGIAVLAVLVALLTLLVAGMLFVVLRYHIVDFKLYPKQAQELDLTGEEISVARYEKLASLMPDCKIYWNVPFQGTTVKNTTTELTVTELAAEDVDGLKYLPQLQKINAMDCRDYDALMYLRQQMPHIQVDYQLQIAGTWYDAAAEVVTVNTITREEILSLQYLPKLTKVVACANSEKPDYAPLRNFCLNTGLEFCISVGEQEISYETTKLELEKITDDELHLLQYLRNLESVHLVKPKAKAKSLLALREQHPDASITWEVKVAGKMYSDDTTEVDLSQVVVEDLKKVEKAMAYLPEAKLLILGLCGKDNPEWGNSKMDDKLAVSDIDNEEIAAFRDRVQDRYKVVWTIRLGPHIALRTDADNFMPNHFGVGRLPDDYAHNLRYCTDMVCLDLGHMTVTHIEFVQFMPKLKYLILAWTNVKYIEPIRNCKELLFLELDNSAIRDLAPLADCTKLEDLNFGNAFPEVEGILGMTWLKNVYMIDGSRSDAWKVSQALPDTRVVTTGNATVGGNWRRMKNYYDMRDMLHAPYMN